MSESESRDLKPLWEADEEVSDALNRQDGSNNSTVNEEIDPEAIELGVTVLLTLIDGRMETSSQNSVLSIYPVPRDSQMFYIRLKTDHYSFSIKQSCVTRTASSFYHLRNILKKYHPYLTIPSLPLYPTLWVSSYQTISTHLATFLAGVLKEKELLASKSLHLFLQTQLGIDKIIDNMEGRRDDELVVEKSKIVKDDRNNAKDGFGGVFGRTA